MQCCISTFVYTGVCSTPKPQFPFVTIQSTPLPISRSPSPLVTINQFSVSKCLLLFGLFIDFVVEFAFYNPHREKSKCWLFSHARLWYPMDCGPSGSSVHGVLQAGILEWIAISSSRESSNQGLELRSPALQADSLPFEPAGLCLHDLCDQCNILKVHRVISNARFHIFLWLSSIALCVCACARVCVYSSEVEQLDHMTVLRFIFEESSYCFPQWLHQFTFLPTVHGEFPFLHISLNFDPVDHAVHLERTK